MLLPYISTDQVIDTYGGKIKDHTHFQFREFPKKTFAFNAEQERLELCLGRKHIPIGPLTPEQEQLAAAASLMAAVGEEGREGEGQQDTASSSPVRLRRGGGRGRDCFV